MDGPSDSADRGGDGFGMRPCWRHHAARKIDLTGPFITPINEHWRVQYSSMIDT